MGATAPTAPVLTWTSGTSVRDPIFTLTNIALADSVQLQIDDDPAFGSTYGDDTNVVDATEAADGQLTFPGIPTLNYSTTYYARARYTRAGQTTAWSNVENKTIDAAAITHLVSGTGATGADTDRSQYINTSGSPVLTYTCNADVGAACLVRSLDAPPVQAHFEDTINTVVVGSKHLIGWSDSALALGAAVFSYPGQTGAGCILRAVQASTSWVIFANGTTSAVTAPNALTAADILATETNRSTNVVTYKVKRAGVTTLIGTVTLTSNIPTNWTATVGADASNTDSGTTNFGGSPVNSANFAITPTASYVGW